MRAAYNRCVEKILVSDAGGQSSRIAYIYDALSARSPLSRPRFRLLSDGTRCAVAAEGEPDGQIGGALRDIVAETLAIGCKYARLSSCLALERLTLRERKLFLCALIAADLPAEKKYIRSRLRGESCALDGFAAFRMGGLREKWDRIVSFVPPDFTREEMEHFMRYFVDGNAGRVYLRGGRVYDEDYRLCRRGRLVGAEAPGELAAETEILLCGAAEVHVCRPLSGPAVDFLRRYYGARTVFDGGEGICGQAGKKTKIPRENG